ncbi:hypothetical protein C5167_005671 [Papaver somniferum]|uniref:Uncharacterized protein n=1 Tax=Papaver somniferum TaxID=3469 RepID=A0A4Y7JC31_PAPSO|nr:hypothetical protein C5167_005671 [Papaver somniferum]
MVPCVSFTLKREYGTQIRISSRRNIQILPNLNMGFNGFSFELTRNGTGLSGKSNEIKLYAVHFMEEP